MDPLKFGLASLRAAVFLRENNLSFVKLSDQRSRFGPWSSKVAIEAPELLIPDKDLPPGLPFFQMASIDGAWLLTAEKGRVDLIWNHTAPTSPHERSGDFFRDAAESLAAILEATHSEAVRLGAVATRYATVDDAASRLSEHFINQERRAEALRRVGNITINAHKEFQLQDFRVNSWVRNRNATISGTSTQVIICENDINTAGDTSCPIDLRAVKDFFPAAAQEMRNILSIYYPGCIPEAE